MDNQGIEAARLHTMIDRIAHPGRRKSRKLGDRPYQNWPAGLDGLFLRSALHRRAQALFKDNIFQFAQIECECLEGVLWTAKGDKGGIVEHHLLQPR